MTTTARVSRSDKSRLAKFTRTGAGSVRVPATTSRTGVQMYPEQGLREYRPPEEVFATDSLASLASVPVTWNHPPEDVTPANYKAYAIGHTTDAAAEARVKVTDSPDEWVRTTLILTDGEALSSIESASKELEISCGYTCRLELTPGVAPDGSHYDAIQRDIRFNHVAVLDEDHKARAGAAARLRLDNKEPMKKIVLDGVELDYGSEAHLNLVQSKADAALKSEKDRADKAEGALAAEKTRADKAEAELAPARLDARVEARLNLLKAAAPFLKAEYETSGKSDSDIRRDALTSTGADVTGKSDAFLEGMFAALTRSDAPAQFHNPGQRPAPRADATRNDDDAFRAELDKKLKAEGK